MPPSAPHGRCGSGRLAGARVLVTRPRGRAEELCRLLEGEGALVVALPVLELLPPEDPRPLRAAAGELPRYAWIAFASPSAVEALLGAAAEAGSLDALRRAKVAAVGPKPAARLREAGLDVRAEVAGGGGAALAEVLGPQLRPGDEVLLPAADQGREELQRGLEARGARVVRVVAYRASRSGADEAELASLRSRVPELVVFGSPRTAEAFLEMLGEGGRELASRMRRVAIGPTTAAALERMGLPAAAVAERPTPEGLVDAAIRALRG